MSEIARSDSNQTKAAVAGDTDWMPWDLTGLHVGFGLLDPDELARPVTSFLVQRHELPLHKHQKGQLVVTGRGSIMCRTVDGLRIVPSNGAVWVPGGVPHSVSISDTGQSYCVFIDQEIAPLPNFCATFSISAMLREMILRMANLPPVYPLEGPTSRLSQVILDELAQMKAEPLHFPVTTHPKIQHIATQLVEAPHDRRTIREWATAVALSERTLARLILKHTGMSFGRWRQQLHIVMAVQRLSLGATVQVVSEELGYDSPSAFTAMFKKHMGKAPRRYLQDRAEGATN